MIRAHIWLGILIGTFLLRAMSIYFGFSDVRDTPRDVAFLMGAACALGIHWVAARPTTKEQGP